MTGVALERLFGATFAASSVITPFFLGAVAGAVAWGRVPAGIAEAHPVRSFVNPTSVLGGVLAVVVCALVVLSAIAGLGSLACMWQRRFVAARGLSTDRGGYSKGMSFTLDPTQSIPEAFQSTATQQLRSIVEALSGQAGLDPDEATHDARKRTKKLRALLRLVRPELRDDVYRRENRALRDASRQLSAVRDAWVLVEALDALVAPPADDITEDSVTGLRAVLVREHRELQAGQGEHGTLGRAAADYEDVLSRLSGWRLPDHGWGTLEDGMVAVAREGRHRMANACSRGSDEDFHEWRKQVKYLRHQFELVRPAWPEVLEAMADTAATLGDLLGTDHDLAVLRERVLNEPALSPETRHALLDRIDERRRGYQRDAFALGRRLHSEKPSALTQRLGRLWKTAA